MVAAVVSHSVVDDSIQASTLHGLSAVAFSCCERRVRAPFQRARHGRGVTSPESHDLHERPVRGTAHTCNVARRGHEHGERAPRAGRAGFSKRKKNRICAPGWRRARPVLICLSPAAAHAPNCRFGPTRPSRDHRSWAARWKRKRQAHGSTSVQVHAPGGTRLYGARGAGPHVGAGGGRAAWTAAMDRRAAAQGGWMDRFIPCGWVDGWAHGWPDGRMDG